MDFLRSRKTSVVIFACLAFISLLAFQNCSQSVHLLGSSNPVQASNLNDMIRETEKEIKVTKAVMSGASRREVNEIRRVATQNHNTDKKSMQITLKSKKGKKTQKAQIVAVHGKKPQKKLISHKKAKSLKSKKEAKAAYKFKKQKTLLSQNQKKLKDKKKFELAKKASLKNKKAQGVTKKKSKSPKPKIIAKNVRKEIK